jgi:hypothetical protein
VDHLQHRALLENAHAQGRRQTRFALHQVQRVQMAGAHVDQTTGIPSALTTCWICSGPTSGFHGGSRVRQADLFVLERRELRRGVGQFAEAPAQVAVDAMLGDALAHQFHRVDTGRSR